MAGARFEIAHWELGGRMVTRICARAALLAALVLALVSGAMAVTISGHVRDANGAGMSGITVRASGGAAVATASDGAYSLSVSTPYTGLVGPEAMYIIQPSSYTYTTITANQINQDFSAYPMQFEHPYTSIYGVSRGAAAWGDYDNNGTMDVAIAGYEYDQSKDKLAPGARIYRNSGSSGGDFADVNARLTGVQDASLAWGDYDNDGKLDLVVAGDTGTAYVTKLYHNMGTTFPVNAAAVLPGVAKGCVAWGDYDNDGRLDLLIAGNAASGRIAKLFRNNGDGSFAEAAGVTLPGLSECSVAWADYDNDGRLDFAIAGNTGSGYVTRVYHNGGNGQFTDVGGGLTGVTCASLAWGDYDNDGKLDLAFAGERADGVKITRICRNTGAAFLEQALDIPGVKGSLAWGDYDNDGRPDLALGGDQGANAAPKICRNNGNGTFTVYLIEARTELTSAAVAWGDLDNDGKLDLMVSGNVTASGYPGAMLYRSTLAAANTAPSAPTNLAVSFAGSDLTISWSPASDSQTPQQGLCYNVRVGTTSGVGNVFAGMADYTTGRRLIPALGSAQKNLSLTIHGLALGTYYCSVQAVDTAFAGSPWAMEQKITRIADSSPPVINSVVFSPALIACGDPVSISVNASDNVGVTSVTADGAALAHFSGSVWTGSLTAASALGSHSVIVVACDAALNSASVSSPYTTVRSFGLGNCSATDALVRAVTGSYVFTVWGTISMSDADGFVVDDGSGRKIRVVAPGRGLVNGDYASVRGTLDASANPPVLTAHVVKKQN